MAKKINETMIMVMAVLAGLFIWSFHNLIYMTSKDIMMSFGIYNNYLQNIAILVVIGAILYFVGKKSLKGLIK